jgi:hypothetical protein
VGHWAARKGSRWGRSDWRGLSVRRGRGVHGDTLVVRGLFGGTGPTDRTHGSVRAGERTGSGADEWGPWDRESWRRQVDPTGQREGEREVRAGVGRC